MKRIAVWADYTWCDKWEIKEMSHLSDDYMLVDIPYDADVEEYLLSTKPQG